MSLACDTVIDLIPLYKDKTASESSRTEIEEHLKQCPNCRKYYSVYSDMTKKNKNSDNITITLSHGERFAELSKRLRRRRQLYMGGALLFLLGVVVAYFRMTKNK